MGPRVADFAEFDGEGLPGFAQRLAERVPTRLETVGDVRFGEDAELDLRVERVVGLVRRRALLPILELNQFRPGRSECWIALPDHRSDEVIQWRCHRLEHAVDAVAVA